MFNHSKTRKKSQNDAPEFKEEHFRRTDKDKPDTKKAELLCGYLYSEDEKKLYAISGFYQDGKLEIRKSEINVGTEAILNFSAYLIQIDNQRQKPTPYSDLLEGLDLEAEDEAAGEPRPAKRKAGNGVFNLSRVAESADFSSEIFLKKYGDSAVSEISIRRDNQDLIVETKMTLFGGMTHIRTDGITNYLVNVINQLVGDLGDRALSLLEAKTKSWGEDERKPIMH